MPDPTMESLATDYQDVMRELMAIRKDVASFREDSARFRGRVEIQLGLIRWFGAFTAAILLTLMTSAIWLSWQVSALTQRVEGLERPTLRVVDRLGQANSPPNPKHSVIE